MSDGATTETDPRDLKISEQANALAELTKKIEQLKGQNTQLKKRIQRLPPGVRNSRSEFGMEVILILGFLHYWIRESQENAIRTMNFFTGLDLMLSFLIGCAESITMPKNCVTTWRLRSSVSR